VRKSISRDSAQLLGESDGFIASGRYADDFHLIC
jgi:hypothetical protein